MNQEHARAVGQIRSLPAASPEARPGTKEISDETAAEIALGESL